MPGFYTAVQLDDVGEMQFARFPPLVYLIRTLPIDDTYVYTGMVALREFCFSEHNATPCLDCFLVLFFVE